MLLLAIVVSLFALAPQKQPVLEMFCQESPTQENMFLVWDNQKKTVSLYRNSNFVLLEKLSEREILSSYFIIEKETFDVFKLQYQSIDEIALTFLKENIEERQGFDLRARLIGIQNHYLTKSIPPSYKQGLINKEWKYFAYQLLNLMNKQSDWNKIKDFLIQFPYSFCKTFPFSSIEIRQLETFLTYMKAKIPSSHWFEYIQGEKEVVSQEGELKSQLIALGLSSSPVLTFSLRRELPFLKALVPSLGVVFQFYKDIDSFNKFSVGSFKVSGVCSFSTSFFFEKVTEFALKTPFCPLEEKVSQDDVFSNFLRALSKKKSQTIPSVHLKEDKVNAIFKQKSTEKGSVLNFKPFSLFYYDSWYTEESEEQKLMLSLQKRCQPNRPCLFCCQRNNCLQAHMTVSLAYKIGVAYYSNQYQLWFNKPHQTFQNRFITAIYHSEDECSTFSFPALNIYSQENHNYLWYMQPLTIGSGLIVHEGLYYMLCQDNLIDKMTQLALEDVRKGKQVIFSGHSQGGALSFVWAAHILTTLNKTPWELKNIHCFAISTVRCLSTKTTSQIMKYIGTFIRFEHLLDYSTLTPPTKTLLSYQTKYAWVDLYLREFKGYVGEVPYDYRQIDSQEVLKSAGDLYLYFPSGGWKLIPFGSEDNDSNSWFRIQEYTAFFAKEVPNLGVLKKSRWEELLCKVKLKSALKYLDAVHHMWTFQCCLENSLLFQEELSWLEKRRLLLDEGQLPLELLKVLSPLTDILKGQLLRSARITIERNRPNILQQA